MTLDATINKSAAWLNSCNSALDNISIKRTVRNRVSVSLYDLAMEHHGSIHILITNKHYGSAFSLLRPQLEAFIRGTWFNLCATDKQIESYKKDKEPPKINSLISAIEKTPGYPENTLKRMKENTWSTLCGYTHGGYYHVAFRNTATEIVSDYDEKYITKLLRKSCSITLLTATAIAALINDEELANELLSLYDDTFN